MSSAMKWVAGTLVALFLGAVFLVPIGIGLLGSAVVAAVACGAPGLVNTASQSDSGTKVNSSLPQATVEYLEGRNVPALAEQNMERYLAAEKAEGVPWEVMAALHYREAGMNPGSSISNGAPLGSGVNVDGVNVVNDANQDAINMAQHFKRMAEYVYDIDVNAASMTQEQWGQAFLAYNRGFLYKNKGRTYDQSPYVMNGIDESHLNMRWIDADTVSGVDGNKAGALTVMTYLNGGSFSTVGAGVDCSGIGTVAMGDLVAPVKGDMVVTSPFDPNRLHPILGYVRPHQGTDIIGGTDIQAISGGTVVFAGDGSSFGNYVKIDHGNGFFSSYAHLSGIATGIKEGARVEPGQFLGLMGRTGLADGVHLHFQIWMNNEKGESVIVDPEKVLADNGMVLPRTSDLPPSPYGIAPIL